METTQEKIGSFEKAQQLVKLGFDLTVLKPGSKRPLHKGWQSRHYAQQELQHFLDEEDCNLGIKTGGDLIVVDVDSLGQDKIDWVLEKVGDTPMKVRSPSGGLHLYYRTRAGVHYGNAVKLRGVYDLRWDGCFIVCPLSKDVNGTPYEWIGEVLPVAELPIIKITPLRERKRSKKAISFDPPAISNRTAQAARTILHPEKYCMKIESIQGQNGSAALVRVVCILRDAGRSPDEAWEFLTTKWNPACARPSWSDEELWHAVERHFAIS